MRLNATALVARVRLPWRFPRIPAAPSCVARLDLELPDDSVEVRPILRISRWPVTRYTYLEVVEREFGDLCCLRGIIAVFIEYLATVCEFVACASMLKLERGEDAS